MIGQYIVSEVLNFMLKEFTYRLELSLCEVFDRGVLEKLNWGP